MSKLPRLRVADLRGNAPLAVPVPWSVLAISAVGTAGWRQLACCTDHGTLVCRSMDLWYQLVMLNAGADAGIAAAFTAVSGINLPDGGFPQHLLECCGFVAHAGAAAGIAAACPPVQPLRQAGRGTPRRRRHNRHAGVNLQLNGRVDVPFDVKAENGCVGGQSRLVLEITPAEEGAA